MVPFAEIHERAVARHGAEDLAARLQSPSSDAELRARTDDRYLAAMAMHVFSAGFRWRVIQAKWEGFEAAFHAFDPGAVAAFDAEAIDTLAQDKRIVRNRPKIIATVDNARFVQETSAAHGGFGTWIADWPSDDTVGLWAAMKAGGNRLGGETGPWILRHMGKDTFRLSGDVVAALVAAGVVSKKPTGKRDLAATQAAFNAWADESGLPLCQISAILACSTGEVRDPYGA